jgi:tetratricopeptide (TPR) repeat protein
VKSRFLSLAVLFASWLGITCAYAESDDAAMLQRGQAIELLKQGKTEEAVGPLLKVLEAAPKDTTPRLSLAYAYERLGRFDEAISQYQKVIELDSQNSVARNNLGVIYDKKGRHDEAIRELEKAVETDPAGATGQKNLAIAKKNQALIQEHERQIAEALKNAEAQPENPNTSYKLARLYAAYGKRDQAIGWLEKALKLGFNDIGYLKVDSALDSLRNEPDYVWLMRGR